MTQTLHKSDLAGMVAQRMGGTRTNGEAALNAVTSAIQESLTRGDRVVITGFGSFEVRKIKERTVRPLRGPNAGRPTKVAAHDRVGFSPGTELAGAVKQNGA